MVTHFSTSIGLGLIPIHKIYTDVSLIQCLWCTVRITCNDCKQEAQLSQRNRAAACLNFSKNISAKSVHLTLLYVTALTSTNHHFTVLRHHAPCVYLMQN